jgi:hypothetical protein
MEALVKHHFSNKKRTFGNPRELAIAKLPNVPFDWKARPAGEITP